MNEDITKINKYINILLEAEIVVKNEMFNSSRQTYYYIEDPVIRFYFQFLLYNIEKIEAGYGLMLYERLKDDIHSFISHSFEDVAICYMEYLSSSGKLNGIFYPFKKLIIDNSELNRSIEIDAIGKDEHSLVVVECKYTNKKRTIYDYQRMVENMSIKMFSGYKKIDYYIISKSGFEDNLLNCKNENLHLISLNDMF